jgi:hypothetical protein
MQKEKIGLEKTKLELVRIISGGNPGALNVITQLLQLDEGMFYLLDLDDMNIRGEKIWLAYNDFCKRNLDKLISCLNPRSKEMVDYINQELSRYSDYRDFAVINGNKTLLDYRS